MTSSPNGVLLIDKPRGMTSHDVVARIRRLAGIKRVGHTGTLDPMAEGLLIVCLGRTTRIAQFLVGLDKDYAGTITLGALSTTYDAEGVLSPQNRTIPEDAELIAEEMQRLAGEQIQLPPPYSAIKVDGKKLYEYAREGAPVPQKPRTVHIRHFKMLRYLPPDVQFDAHVGSGVYVRSMAHDLGVALGCGGYLSMLRRTCIGGFSVDQAVPLETLIAEPDLLAARLLSVTEALGHLPKMTIRPDKKQSHLHGQPFETNDVLETDGILQPAQPTLVLDTAGNALSIVRGHVRDEQGDDPDKPVMGATSMIFKPVCVLDQP